MVVCQYFLRGQCRFGDSCRNEHPQNGQQSTFGSSGNIWLRTGGSGSNAKTNLTLPYDAQSMANDMKQGADKPIWPLSCYAPAKHEPVLVPGLDESPEELRVKAYTAIQAGNLNEYLSYETNKISAADQVYSNARANSAEAFDKARKQSSLVPYTGNTTSAFGTTTTGTSAFPSTSSAFATQPAVSAFGTPNTAPATSVFGQPAFGQTSFGQTSTTAQTGSTSVFGQPSQPTTSAFGQPSQPTSVFGHSSFGQPAAQTSNPLIKPASGAFSAFSGSGPSAFGAAASTPSHAANTTGGGGGSAFSAFAGSQPSAFGLASNNNVTSVFGQPSFGQPAPNANAGANQGSVFGTPSAFGQQQQPQQQTTSSVFGANPATTSVFGTPTTTAPTSAFGQSAFGGTPASNVFGTGAPAPTVFGAGAAAPSPFGAQPQQQQPKPQPQQAQQQQQPQPQSSTSAFQPLNSTRSISMSSASSHGPLDLSGISTRFPYQPGSTPYDSMLPPNYMELVPQTAKEAFVADKFQLGRVPEWVPPLEVR